VTKAAWIRDCLHDLRGFAKEQGLVDAEKALGEAIIRVSIEAGIPTRLKIKDLIELQPEDEGDSSGSEKAADT